MKDTKLLKIGIMIEHTQYNKVICLGSAPNMTMINCWNTEGIGIIGCNNVWKGTDKWDILISPGDYPDKKFLKTKFNVENFYKTKKIYYPEKSEKSFKTAMNYYAGKPWNESAMHLGPSTYFALMYWCLYYVKPKYIACLGLDMSYESNDLGETHFYGKGYDIQTRGMPDLHYQIYKHFHGDFSVIDKFFERLNSLKGQTEIYNLSDNKKSLLPWKKITFEKFKKL